MKFALVVIVTTLSACGQSAKQVPAPQVSDAIAKRGAKVVTSEMDHGKSVATWSYVQEHAASGDRSWLAIAAKLKPYTDAGNAEGLENAVVDALP